jgi:hypothetical protein
MKSINMKGVILVAICGIGSVISPVDSNGAKKEKYSATLTDFKGKVSIQKPGEKLWLPVAKGMPLERLDRIKTGANSYAELLIDDGSLLRVGENTDVSLSELSADFKSKRIQSTVFLHVGKLMAKIARFMNTRSRFKVRTVTTVAGVRGTAYVVEADATGKTIVGVFEGRVSVGRIDSKGELDEDTQVFLVQGNQTIVQRDGAPLPPVAFQQPMLLYRNRMIMLNQRAVQQRQAFPMFRDRRMGVFQELQKRWEKIRKMRGPSHGPKKGYERHKGIIPGAPPPTGEPPGGHPTGVIPGAPPPSGESPGGSPKGVIPGAPTPP